MGAKAGQTVDLSGPIELLERHLTSALCQEAWEELRDKEREREWTLEWLVSFWTAVTLDPPPSLSHALAQATGEPGARYQAPKTSAQAFFARSQDLSWEFFQAVFERFRKSIAKDLRPVFAQEVMRVRERFTSIEAVDGSNLDAVARRLKVLWSERATVLPGAILAFYDLCDGTLARLIFDPNLAGSEFNRAGSALAHVPAGTLEVGDKLYGVPKMFEAATALDVFLLARRFPPNQVVRTKLLSQRKHEGGTLEDWEAIVGSGQTAAPQNLRLIRWKKGKTKLELLTNVLDPDRLSALEAMTVYRYRWKVERLFSDLKEVLKLNRFYGANVNAVGMQVYAAAIVHTALRVAQGRAATTAKVEPERISTKKLFPRVAAAACLRTGAQWGFEMTRRANPGVKLVEPNYSRMPGMHARLKDLLVEVRSTKRRKPRTPKKAWRQIVPRRRRPAQPRRRPPTPPRQS
jgi:hypothetical protein